MGQKKQSERKYFVKQCCYNLVRKRLLLNKELQTQKHSCSLTYWKMLANIQETTQHNARIF